MSRTVHQYIEERWNECKAWPLFNLPKELIRSLFYAARKGAPKRRKRHDNALNLLNQAKLEKLKSAQIDSAEKAVEENIVAMNYFEIGISERRWKTVKEADSVYSTRCHLGFGWVDCAHQWSCKGHGTYSSQESLNFLKDTVLRSSN